MKKLIVLLVSSFTALAQQEPLYTQYQFNMLSINPAYAGSRDALTATALYRAQWVGIEGAPRTATVTLHSPVINQHFGAGFSLVHDAIGPVNQTSVFLDLSGRVQAGRNAWLAGGIKLGLSFHRANLTELDVVDGSDFAFAQNYSATLPNAGFGLYYYTPSFYVGMSMPRVFQNDIYPVDNNEEQVDVRERRHYFLSAGAIIPMSEQIEIKPNLLLRLVESAPLSFDITPTFIFGRTFWAGVNYRHDESVGLIFAYQITPALRLGYSYDHMTSALQPFAGSSHEVSLIYDLVYKPSKIKSPRYF